jgi:valyl-tRNA synthetase
MTLKTSGGGELPKAYDPRQVEGRIYQFWMDRGYFTPKIDPARKPFVIIMPPPNVTGELHLGHALTATLEDIMIRWHRMKGEPALWLPGTDHAGIATQVVVEQQLAKEGLSRHDLGREQFEERVWKWVRECKDTIRRQHQRLGASCDWTRESFTLDEGPSRAVRTSFVRLYHKGLIYRGERIINWCPRCRTALSDLEVNHREVAGHLWYIKYPLVEEEGFITVATTRPETMLGDTAVAVHPQDNRFKRLIGKKASLPVIGRIIPIVADEVVDPGFGTGAVKVTPAHDPVDFEIAQRQGLPLVNILNPEGTLNENAGPYAGVDRFVCRQELVSRLEQEGLLLKIEPYLLSVGHCDRCNTIVEPWASEQWFIRMKPLAEPAIQAVEEGRIVIIPEQFTKVYLHWMKNIRDWCISRQLWWGHRIPVWYCRDCPGLTVTVEDPQVCAHCGSGNIFQDPDVLDTWFSSALWTHSPMGWPENTEDLRYFYPTTVMETGYDILFFWVARMIMMGLENTGDIPFRTVYLHGLIRDEKGEKMGKLKGNVLNPLELIERYGTDALRLALTLGSSAGNDIRVGVQKLEGCRNFANKLWNAARFVLGSLEGQPGGVSLPPAEPPAEDRWILSRVNHLVARVNQLLEDFQFGEAERLIHDFLWSEFCDWYIELSKIRLRTPGSPSPLPVLVQVLETSLLLLHPFMPFITEELWQNLVSRLPADRKRADSIMIMPYPRVEEEARDIEAEREMELIIEIIRSIRNARAQFKVEPAKWIETQIYARNKAAVESHLPAIEFLARARPLHILSSEEKKLAGDKALVLVLKDAEVVLPMAGMIDIAAERQRLEKEAGVCQREVERLRARLEDGAFLARAPASVIEREREKLSTWQDKLERLKQLLAQLS